jgi:AcrR family transcriptional regulator
VSEIKPRAVRADARRSKSAILDAAVVVFGERPEAGLDHVAAAAGVSRQTVYAHFGSREALLSAAVDRVTDEAMAAIDAADIDHGPAAEALLKVIEAGWDTFDRHQLLLQAAAAQASQEDDVARHLPVTERLERLVRRGQAEGELDARWKPAWLVRAVVALGHAAGDCVQEGTMNSDEARATVRESVLRLLTTGSAGGQGPASSSGSSS